MFLVENYNVNACSVVCDYVAIRASHLKVHVESKHEGVRVRLIQWMLGVNYSDRYTISLLKS